MYDIYCFYFIYHISLYKRSSGARSIPGGLTRPGHGNHPPGPFWSPLWGFLVVSQSSLDFLAFARAHFPPSWASFWLPKLIPKDPQSSLQHVLRNTPTFVIFLKALEPEKCAKTVGFLYISYIWAFVKGFQKHLANLTPNPPQIHPKIASEIVPICSRHEHHIFH